MAPKRSQQKESASPAKKAKVESIHNENNKSALVKSLITDDLLGQTYCEELGIDLASGSNAVFQWLACSSMFGSRLSEVQFSLIVRHHPYCDYGLSTLLV